MCVVAPDMLQVFNVTYFPTAVAPFMQAILDSSQSPYAQLLATSSLLKVVTDHVLRCAVWV